MNLGDLAFGIGLFFVACDPTPQRTVIFVLVSLASATLLTGFLVLTGALAFFIGRSESGELGFHGMLLLGAYPVDLFAGAIRIFLFTLIPAAFVSAVPAQLVEDFDLGRALTLGLVAAALRPRRRRHLHRRPPPLHQRQHLDEGLAPDVCADLSVASRTFLAHRRRDRQLLGRSFQGWPLRGSGSLGRPRTRSLMMLRWMFSVPPPMRLDHWNRKTSFQKPPSGASSCQSVAVGPRIDMIVLPTCSTWWLLSSLRIDRLRPRRHALRDGGAHPVHEPALDLLAGVEPGELLAHGRVVVAPEPAGQVDELARAGLPAPADRGALGGERGGGDAPAVADVAEHVRPAAPARRRGTPR